MRQVTARRYWALYMLDRSEERSLRGYSQARRMLGVRGGELFEETLKGEAGTKH